MTPTMQLRFNSTRVWGAPVTPAAGVKRRSCHIHHAHIARALPAAAAATSAVAVPTALITGCSTGIGREAAALLAEKGWRVFAGVRTAADASSVAALHPAVTPLILDVTSEDSISAAVAQVRAALGGVGGLQLLVNNAGVGLVAPAEFVPLDKWRSVLDVNLIGALAMVQAFLPLLREGAQPGRIINISSVAGHLALPHWSAYNCSKAALDMLSEVLRYELQPLGVPVVLIKPGPIATSIWDKSRAASEDIMAGLPAPAEQLYGEQLDRIRSATRQIEQDALPASQVAELIAKAAAAPHPKATYLIGKNATLIFWAKRLLPDGIWRALTNKMAAP